MPPHTPVGTLVLEPDSVAPLGSYTVSGDGYTPNGTASLVIQTPAAVVTAPIGFDASGGFSLNLNADGSTGDYVHTVRDLNVHGKHDELSPSVTLTVS